MRFVLQVGWSQAEADLNILKANKTPKGELKVKFVWKFPVVYF